MSKFWVGDRVVVYTPVPIKGKVLGVTSDGFLRVHMDGNERTYQAHPKQCRRLRPKAPRRRVWLSADDIELESLDIRRGLRSKPGFVEFVEVRKKK